MIARYLIFKWKKCLSRLRSQILFLGLKHLRWKRGKNSKSWGHWSWYRTVFHSIIKNYLALWSSEQFKTIQSNMIRKFVIKVLFLHLKFFLTAHESIRTIRVKLSLERAVHTIYVTGFTDHAQNESQNSNIVELLSENFFPFTFYCFNNVHHKNKSWPEKGCCAYQDTLPIERSNLSKAKELVHYGLLNEPVSFPRVELFDLVSKKTRSLIEGRSRMGNKNYCKA